MYKYFNLFCKGHTATACWVFEIHVIIIIRIFCIFGNNYHIYLIYYLQPWSGEYVDFKGKGTYKCVCCGSDLFRLVILVQQCYGCPKAALLP